jgi:electron transfer flavoprotein alpha/beta subunit
LRECSNGKLIVERKLDRGHGELVEVELPAVLTFKVEAAESQYVSFRRLEQARGKDIPVWHADLDLPARKLPQWPSSEKKLPPRARVKKKFMPDASLSAAERVKMIMAGGMQPQQSGQNSAVLEGNPDYLSEQLFRFLKHHELI